MSDFNCYLISNKPQYYELIKKRLAPYHLNYYDGSNIPSFSSLVNSCVENCPSEIVIMMSDKVMPEPHHVEKTIKLLNEGHGFVGLFLFGFFGLRKDLFRKIGDLDERFIGGGYEDHDFYMRIREANISAYISEEVQYNKRTSSYDYSINKPFFIKKWIPHYKPRIELFLQTFERQIPEAETKRSYGPFKGSEFLPWSNGTVHSGRALPMIY